MDFGVVGLDGGSTEGGGFGHMVSEAETRQRGCGSGFLKQGRSGIVEDEWTGLKMARNGDGGGVSKAMLVQSKSPLLRSSPLFPDGGQQQQQLLSFSAPKSDGLLVSNEGLLERSYQSGSLGYYHNPSVYARNAGLGSGSLNGSMHGMLAGIRGPFTPSQWMELEHQALIYKYLNANVPVPPSLLISLRRGLSPSGFSGFSPVALRANTWGWGSFHLGFSGNMDPEPGRCRRTDGKKWRCSRDAVADQKYCERHMNRGRHRSRKPVEGQTGHAAASGTATATKAMPIATSSASAASGSGTPNSVTLAHQQQMKSLQPNADTSAMRISRMLMNKSNADNRMQDSNALSMLSSMHSRLRETQFTVPKQHVAAKESSQTEFGLVSSNSLLNPLKSSYIEGRSFNSSHDLNDREKQSHPLRHFIDDWPKSRSDQSAITWPEVGEVRSDRTQLSISIPAASSDFSSSTSSPTQEKLTLSPLKLSREFDPVQMGLGVGGAFNEAGQKQASWIPISWENSMGGPLGEVLNKTNNTPRDRKYSSSALNLMTEGWDASPRLRASPTGVLQKTTFTSISNSSTGSSPNRAHDHISLCDDLLGSAFVNSTIPSL